MFPRKIGTTCKITLRCNPEDQHRHLDRRENLKSQIKLVITCVQTSFNLYVTATMWLTQTNEDLAA